jgi:hypothetical protein
VRYYWKITSNNTDLSALAYIIEGVSMRLDRLFSRVCRAIPLLAAASLLLLLSACSKSEPTEAEMRQAVEARLADSGMHFSGFSQFRKSNWNCYKATDESTPWPQNNNQPIPGQVYICGFEYVTIGVRHEAGANLNGINGGLFSAGYFGSSWRFYETDQNLKIMFF